MEHEERLEDLEGREKELEEHREQLEEDIEETRGDWESKKEDSSVPGAQPSEEERDRRSEETGGSAAERAGQ